MQGLIASHSFCVIQRGPNARRVESGGEIVIRVNPEKPGLSLVRNNDQRKTHRLETIWRRN